jgi:putative tricarboxylic transport membrane protein
MAPLVLALVLGDMAETNFRQALLGSQGSLGVFFGSPLSGSLMVLALVMLFWPLLGMLRRRAAPAPTSGATPAPEPEPVRTSA